MPPINRSRRPGEAYLETRTIYDMLRALTPGEGLAYEQINKAIGADVQGDASRYLRSARAILLREDKIVTVCLGDGQVRRVANDEHAAVMQDHRKRAANQARRGLVKGACVDYGALKPEQRRLHNVELAQLGLLAATASESANRKLLADGADPKRLTSADAMRVLVE